MADQSKNAKLEARVAALEQELEQARREAHVLKTALDQAPVGIALTDADINIYYCNPEGLGIRGGNAGDLVEIPPEAFDNWQVFRLNGEPYDIEDLPLLRAMKSGKLHRDEFIVRHQDGTDHICDVFACPVFDQDQIIGGMVFFPDVTERKRTEEALKKSEERLRLVIEGSRDAPWDWDLVRDELYYSPQWWAQLGYAPDELPADAELWRRLLHPDDADRTMAVVDGAIASGKPGYQVECRLRHKDGHDVPLLARAIITYDDQGKPVRVSGTNLDLTERHRAQRAMQQVERMEAIGTLAGGIAHDFNNLLGAITGNLSLALPQTGPGTELRAMLEDARDGATQATSLTKQLLTFSRGGAPVKEVRDLNALVQETARLMLRGARSDCAFQLAPDLWPAEVDPGQFEQVVSNLVLNANQAMPEGGEITVQTENVELEAGFHVELPAGRYVKLSVEDRGIGIRPEHTVKIFEPYFTTKQRGSGLGLASAYAIVKQHGGRITVYSELGRGSVFVVYLPATDRTPADAADAPRGEHSGAGTVLVMDDQDFILKLAVRMLDKFGYRAVTATHGNEAIDRFREAHDAGTPFDLVILDLTIPGGMGGVQTLAELRKIDPGIKAVVSSGYSNDPIMAHYADHGFDAVAPKPYTKETLAEVLDRLFGSENDSDV